MVIWLRSMVTKQYQLQAVNLKISKVPLNLAHFKYFDKVQKLN